METIILIIVIFILLSIMLEILYKIFYDKDKPLRTKLVWLIVILIILIPIIYTAYTGEYIFSTNSENNENAITENEIEITDLKNYTLNLCQEIRVFLANRVENTPDSEDYDDWQQWDNDYSEYTKETMSLYKKHYSQKTLQCYYEFEKKGFSDYELRHSIETPTNRLVIEIDIIPGLELLANNL